MQSQVQVGVPEEVVEETFDLRTHYFDSQSKRLSHVNSYRLHTIDGVQYFERPKGSLNLFYKNNEAAGRLIDPIKMKVDTAAAHEEWVAPLSADQKEAAKTVATAAENVKLRKELEQIKKEKEAVLKAAASKVGEDNGNKVSNPSRAKSNVSGYSPGA